MHHRQLRLLFVAVMLCVAACSKHDEVARTSPAQNTAMSNLDAIAPAPVKTYVNSPAPK
jgi:hypothetical protein